MAYKDDLITMELVGVSLKKVHFHSSNFCMICWIKNFLSLSLNPTKNPSQIGPHPSNTLYEYALVNSMVDSTVKCVIHIPPCFANL